MHFFGFVAKCKKDICLQHFLEQGNRVLFWKMSPRLFRAGFLGALLCIIVFNVLMHHSIGLVLKMFVKLEMGWHICLKIEMY